MSYATATKDQMKVWKSALRPEKDFPERSANRIMLEIKKDEAIGGYLSTLSATDGYQLIRRNIQSEPEAKAVTIAIPFEAVEAAEKAMKKTDRAYFDDGKITIRAVMDVDDSDMELTAIRAVIPFIEQLDLFKDFGSVLEEATNNSMFPEKTVVIDAKVLKKIVDQLKSSDARVFVKFHIKGHLEPVVMQAFDGIEDEQITAAVMPIKE